MWVTSDTSGREVPQPYNVHHMRAVLAVTTLVMGGLLIAIMLMSERSSGRQSARRRRWFTALAVVIGVTWVFLAAIVAGIVGPSE